MTYDLIKLDGETVGICEHGDMGLGLLQWFHNNVHAYSMAYAMEHGGYSVESVDDIDCHDVENLISTICKRLAITMQAEFIPFSQSRHATPKAGEKPWRSLNWRIRIRRFNPKPIETEYSQGEAHAPSYRHKNRVEQQYRVAYEIETGKQAAGVRFGYKAEAYGNKPIAPPSIGEVMQCLARDTDVLDYAAFEDWAPDMGYDVDSREAERVYRKCVELALALRNAIGQSALDEIRLAAQFN